MSVVYLSTTARFDCGCIMEKVFVGNSANPDAWKIIPCKDCQRNHYTQEDWTPMVKQIKEQWNEHAKDKL